MAQGQKKERRFWEPRRRQYLCELAACEPDAELYQVGIHVLCVHVPPLSTEALERARAAVEGSYRALAQRSALAGFDLLERGRARQRLLQTEGDEPAEADDARLRVAPDRQDDEEARVGFDRLHVEAGQHADRLAEAAACLRHGQLALSAPGLPVLPRRPVEPGRPSLLACTKACA